MSGHQGSCHCGKVTLSLVGTPAEVAECNCSLCRRLGGLWHYPRPQDLTVTGEQVGYVQGDCSLTTWHCPTCGCVTHWTPIDPSYPKVGVNIRMFAPELWRDLPRRQIDGASF